MNFINPETFVPETTREDGTVEGTVEVTLWGETRRVRASKAEKYGWLFAYGIEGCYRTGQKWWPGHIHRKADGSEKVDFGRFDNHPKFNKTNIRFKKEG